MIRPRLSIRWVMIAVVALAVALRLALVAFRVFGQPNAQTLSHLRRFRDDAAPFVSNHGTSASQSWSEYWRRCLGVPWPGGLVCSCKAQEEADLGRATVDIDTSHDMDAMHQRMSAIPWRPPGGRGQGLP